MSDVLERARRIADDVLFPSALQTDAADLVPRSSLDLLASEGLYGIAGPVEAGGLDLDAGTTHRVVETLAAGCLTTTFVWLQHHSVVRAVASSSASALRDEWLEPLCRGERRAGIALAGERPGPALLTASDTRDGVVLQGDAPWVTGWDRIDAVLVAARAGDDVVRLLVDTSSSPTLDADRLRLVAVNASGTVTLRFRGHRVPGSREIGREPLADVLARDAAGLRSNGSLALGVAARCCRLLDDDVLERELAEVRAALDEADVAGLPAARAAASAFALRVAAALTVAAGARGLLLDQHPQRLAREALFVLVFGSRPSIKAQLLARVADPPGTRE